MSFKKAFQKALLNWYSVHKRDLPFRKNPTPYTVWLSEVMAQQTTLTAVLPYFERFLKAFPSVASVAQATEDDLLTLWQGLGYYSRVRNFQKACQTLMKERHGQCPQYYEDWMKLSGVGEYTASAVTSICFGEKKAVVDGNVKRVLARLFWFDADPKTKTAQNFFKTKALELLDTQNPGDFNQAMMELGALICKPKRAECTACPVQSFCIASTQNPLAVPLKSKLKTQVVVYKSLVITQDNQILLKKPRFDNLIQNMWELPSVYEEKQNAFAEWRKEISKQFSKKSALSLKPIQHSITNKKITVESFWLQNQNLKCVNESYSWVTIDQIDSLALNTISRKVLKQIRNY